ncbi:MAG: (deoxy)nucleoside triphosphate pyrophosphohydrolase [Myxococcales bacterium]|nr:(deoxy)nucleoside triphosphate pyrophosphohydrolase [Myxococcales bacterium]
MAAKMIRVVAAVVERDGRYLITQRRDQAVLPLLWEFPGGRAEEGERDEDALKRELRERIDAEAVIGQKLTEKHHVYDGYAVALCLYAATLDATRPVRARRVKDFRWVTSDEFEQYPFPDADQATMDLLLGIKRYEP